MPEDTPKRLVNHSKELVHGQPPPVKGTTRPQSNSPGTNKKEFLFGARYQIVKDQSADTATAFRRPPCRRLMHSSHIAPRVNTPQRFFLFPFGMPQFAGNPHLSALSGSFAEGLERSCNIMSGNPLRQ